jgi:probable rRNA maturation factor
MKAPSSNIQAPEKLQIPSIKIFNRQRTRKINLRLLKQITNALLVELKIINAEFGINLVGAKKMADLNWKFLKHEGSTDVITFDYAVKAGRASRLPIFRSSGRLDGRDACPTLCGELFICVDDAIAQAKQFGTSWQSEIVRYIVHGVLHLLGHDDRRAVAHRKMKREENHLLHELSGKFSLAQIGGASKLRA